MDIKKRKEELQSLYDKQKKLHENALSLMKSSENEMLKLEGAFQELTRLENEKVPADKPNNKQDVKK
jgi:ketopantoate hydroxymethyltransferase